MTTSTQVNESRPEVKCPHCGNTDVSSMEYVEDVQSTRRLGGFREDGTFMIDEESTEHVEYAENSRFCCQKCNEDFPIPEGLNIDWGTVD